MKSTASTVRLHRFAAISAVAVALAGCEEVRQITDRFRAATPHERYAESLRAAGLAATALARDWTMAAERAVRRAPPVEAPFRETGYLAPEQPTALGYRFRVRGGRHLAIELELESDRDALVFLDLFRVPEDSADAPSHVASADSGAYRLDYEPWFDGEYLLRIQPELLRGGRYTLTIIDDASLAFPVAGRDTRAIRSFFGAPRDGGSRDHHGVDIFAPRGTPAIAASAGLVRRVRTTPRGGNVVWVRDTARNHSLYYAHLDRQLVSSGMRVERGDTIGLIGNTGNARTTPPHLHFGIYRRRSGPVDPFPYLYRDDRTPAPLEVDTDLLGEWSRAANDRIRLRSSPNLEAPAVAELPLHTAMRVVAATGSWYRVELPDGRTGFVHDGLAEALEGPIRSESLVRASTVHARPAPGAALVDSLAAGEPVPVLGRFGRFLYVRAPNGRTGWLRAASP